MDDAYAWALHVNGQDAEALTWSHKALATGHEERAVHLPPRDDRELAGRQGSCPQGPHGRAGHQPAASARCRCRWPSRPFSSSGARHDHPSARRPLARRSPWLACAAGRCPRRHAPGERAPAGQRDRQPLRRPDAHRSDTSPTSRSRTSRRSRPSSASPRSTRDRDGTLSATETCRVRRRAVHVAGRGRPPHGGAARRRPGSRLQPRYSERAGRHQRADGRPARVCDLQRRGRPVPGRDRRAVGQLGRRRDRLARDHRGRRRGLAERTPRSRRRSISDALRSTRTTCCPRRSTSGRPRLDVHARRRQLDLRQGEEPAGRRLRRARAEQG